MGTTEHTINDALALALRGSRRAWRGKDVVLSEQTGTLIGSAGQPDILVLEKLVSPVAIETEVLPAPTVEPDARSRLGRGLKSKGTILSSIAVRLPKRLRSLDNEELKDALSAAGDIEMALFTGPSDSDFVRWPKDDWLKGSIADLSLLTQAASVPPMVIDEAANELMAGIDRGAGLFAEVADVHEGAIQRISDELRQENGLQTWRMAAAIVANAFVFHESLAGGPGGLTSVQSLDELSGAGSLNKSAILGEWAKILEVNYWSIFDIARRILEHTPGSIGKRLVGVMAATAARLLERRLMRSHDLTGAVFQRLIADRKFLAAYYTTPPSAALLAGLAIREDKTPAGKKWGDADSLKTMRIVT
jgi:NAD(P)-dependent dehydrogenase (short-subunit alcohol dehydrogenase family)